MKTWAQQMQAHSKGMPQQERAKLEALLRKIEALETQVTGPLDFEQYADMLAEAKSQLLGVIKAAADITKMCALVAWIGVALAAIRILMKQPRSEFFPAVWRMLLGFVPDASVFKQEAQKVMKHGAGCFT